MMMTNLGKAEASASLEIARAGLLAGGASLLLLVGLQQPAMFPHRYKLVNVL